MLTNPAMRREAFLSLEMDIQDTGASRSGELPVFGDTGSLHLVFLSAFGGGYENSWGGDIVRYPSPLLVSTCVTLVRVLCPFSKKGTVRLRAVKKLNPTHDRPGSII